MTYFDVSNPKYNNQLRKLETTDPNHADTFNPMFRQLLENEESLQKLKLDLVISEELPAISERKPGTLYFRITDVVSQGVSNIVVSPKMGLKIEE